MCILKSWSVFCLYINALRDLVHTNGLGTRFHIIPFQISINLSSS